MVRKIDIQKLKEGILAKNRVYLSRAITLIESKNKGHKKYAQELLGLLMPYTGNSLRIGITGVPGAGKSTFINALGTFLIQEQKLKVAVLAIDPSSNITNGSILGDKTRMEELAIMENAYIRPSSNRGDLGGVHQNTFESILLCEATGYDVVLVETVGVGQAEILAHSMTDFFLLLKVAGTGDELQGIKRGIMEMADAIVMNKADENYLKECKLAKVQMQRALHFYPVKPSGWNTQIALCSSAEKSNIDGVWEMILDYFEHVKSNDYFDKKRKEQKVDLFQQHLKNKILTQYFGNSDFMSKYNTQIETIAKGSKSPFQALDEMNL